MTIPTDAIAAPLVAALAARGYDSLTPVQQAMLADAVGGRDALVSAQTGSGKTVAFGLAIAPDLLAGDDRLPLAGTPLALVVAPTRELALQVARELDWLYAEAGAQVATCVGGMDYRSERRALDRGAHLVVGTPGRLRDHIERGSLDLSALRAVVLDEADEMLDLGFREDLEFILSAAPEGRRTLMFSATVPPAIAALAQDFQRDALRIRVQGEARQHVDIEYRAIAVSARDREPAIFNLLRFYEARTAIVFCKTRLAVNHLFARMGNRGFQVVALSGELSQQERTHALQSLRDGRARVCIATDVAARGIDLPGLDLVIHADLPANSETLLHRSGRTGRAGQKGVSALIVTPTEHRKANRLLQGAHVVAGWGSPPSADEVLARDAARLLDDPALQPAPDADEAATVEAILSRFGAERAAAAFARLWRSGRSAPEDLQDAAPGAPTAPAPRPEFGASVWFTVPVGRDGGAEARWLLPKICDAGGITRGSIGAIRVQASETFVQIAEADAARFGAAMDLEPGLTLRRIEGEPPLAAPARPRPSPGDRGDKPRAPRVPRADRADSLPAPRPSDSSAPRPRPLREDGPARRSPPPVAAPVRAGDPGAGKPRTGRADAAPREDRPAAPPRDTGAGKALRDDRGARPPKPKGGTPGKPRWKARGAADAAPPTAAGDRAAPRPRSAGFKSFGPRADAPRPPDRKPGSGAPGDIRPRDAKAKDTKPRDTKPGDKKSWEARPKASKMGGKPGPKPEGKAAPSRKPAPRPADPTDTSRRYTPPKPRPKS